MPGMRQTPLTSFSLPPRIRMDGGLPEGGGGPVAVDMPAGEPKASTTIHESRKGVPWTESEHMAFLMGLKKLGKGNWRGVSRYFVPSRTPTQVASHAQKHFLRLQGVSKRKSRFSMLEQVGVVEAGGAQANGGAGVRPAWGGGVVYHQEVGMGRTQYKALAVKQSPKGKQQGPYYGVPPGMPYPHRLPMPSSSAAPHRLPIPYPGHFTKICRPQALHAPAARSEDLAAEVARHLKTQSPLQSSAGSAFEPAEKTPSPSPRGPSPVPSEDEDEREAGAHKLQHVHQRVSQISSPAMAVACS